MAKSVGSANKVSFGKKTTGKAKKGTVQKNKNQKGIEDKVDN